MSRPNQNQSPSSLSNQSGEPELLTVVQVAARLQVPRATVYYWVSREEIPYVHVGKHLRFIWEEVLAAFRDRTTNRRGPCSKFIAPVEKSSSRGSLKTEDPDRAEPAEGSKHGNL